MHTATCARCVNLWHPMAISRAVTAEIEAEQAVVAGNRELIRRFEEKIRATITRVWCEDPGFVLTLGQGGYGLASVRHLDS